VDEWALGRPSRVQLGDPPSGECNCTCDSVTRGKSKEEYQALIFSKALSSTVDPADLSSPRYHKLTSSFHKDEDKDTFSFEKEVGSGRSVRVNVGVPEWLESVLGEKGLSIGPGASLQNCPNGICIGGDNKGNATVNNFEIVPPPPRRLDDQELGKLTRIAAQHPFKILILYTQHDEEAYRLAKQIGNTLEAAGWTLSQPVTEAMMFREGGGPLYGMEIDYRGHDQPSNTPVQLDPNEPWGALAKELVRLFPEDFFVHSSSGNPNDRITLSVYANPKSRPSP
jgi:hypothetical protein